MPFKYNPPTSTSCEVCNNLIEREPIIDSHSGKSSSSKSFPIHNWYYFVLGYSPSFPEYVIKKEKISKSKIVLDPFMGTGTTLICCKKNQIPSYGVDANDFFVTASKTKLDWTIQLGQLEREKTKILKKLRKKFGKYKFNKEIIKRYEKRRPEMLTERYLSDIPFIKLTLIKDTVADIDSSKRIISVFELALHSIILPSSNIKYGPGFGIGKLKDDVDVLGLFEQKLERIISDLKGIKTKNKKVLSKTKLGDSRKISKDFKENSIDFMITSPPYPGDHEYTKHTRLELIFSSTAENLSEFRTIKKRMIRGSTTNIYKDDNERKNVGHINSINEITQEIAKRLIRDNATSGFEKLYTKLVWEYFGGMYTHFLEAQKILKKGGKYYLLVGDSHAFKMVHIQTSKILEEIAKEIGFRNTKIELWQKKYSSSHKYLLNEDILILEK